MRRRALALLAALFLAFALVPPVQAAERHTVTYDHYSMIVDGHRVLVQSAEFHYFRLPSPDLWRDVLEKYRAAGFNAVSLYFDWAYHSPAPGRYDFTGVRDLDRLLRTAGDLGLYVIARPGPYINAETTGGGFPAWLKNVPGRARTSAPGYTAAYRDWLHHVDAIIARHQVTRGGPVLLYNAENEYAANTDPAYMADVIATARGDGIDVPITHNQCCGASGVPTWASGEGAVDIPGVDDYPQSFDCPNAETTWGPWGEGVTRRLRDDAPVFAAEYQAGSIDSYDAGYERCRALTGPAYMRYFYRNNLIASGATLFNYYMGFGGTNWGWLAQPNDVYTSYDYGSAITEDRALTPKYAEFKRQGYFLAAAPGLTKTDPVAAPASDDPAITPSARANPDTGEQFALIRHTDRAATTTDTATLDWNGVSLPVTVAGHDASVLVANHAFGGQRLVASSSQLLTTTTDTSGSAASRSAAGPAPTTPARPGPAGAGPRGVRDVAVLYGHQDAAGRTVLRYAARPSVRVLAGSVRASYANGALTLDYTHRGLARIEVTGGGRRPLLLLIGTDEEAGRFWRSGPALVYGTDLVRSATLTGGTLALRADTARREDVEVFAPARTVTVNGDRLATRTTASGSLAGTLPGPRTVTLPALDAWRTRGEAPEARPGFDDSAWTAADHTTTVSPYEPLTKPVLYADDYGYHYGPVWYRGHFTASGAETTVDLNAITGKRGRYLVWLNGRYLGWAAGGVQADADEPRNPDPGPGHFTVPSGLLTAGEKATLAVLVENMGDNDDWTAEEYRHKQPRGLVGASVAGAGSALTWKIQGNRTDPVRGPLNDGGLYGERAGWHLPGYPDAAWTRADGLSAAPGVRWYRTTARLDLPRGQDTAVDLRFDGAPPSGARVLIYVNGWNLGQYSADIGPQRDFTLPTGLLRTHGTNTVALAVIGERATAIGPVRLVAAHTERGGVPVRDVPSPAYPGGS